MIAANVAQLLKSPTGATRDLLFDELDSGLERSAGVRGAVRGSAHLVRTPRGILVKAEYQTTVELSCGRCLEMFQAPLEGAVEEEFLPSIDVVTGVPLEREPDEWLIGEDHVIDLSEAIRQDVLVGVPLQPLCRDECRGLCPQCGTSLNRESCSCEPVSKESPFQVLSDLFKEQSRNGG